VTDRFDNPSWTGEPGEPKSADQAGGALPPVGTTVEETMLLDPEEAQDLLENASENVLEGWPAPLDEPISSEDAAAVAARVDQGAVVHARHDDPGTFSGPEIDSASSEHAPGELLVPPGFPVLEGFARGEHRAVGIVVARFNGDVTSRLLEGALEELEARGVAPEAITVMPVPGAFELPLAAMALAKTRRFACVVALGCVIRGDTPHFDYVCNEAASGLQLAAIETGVPVSFGVLTLDRADQAEQRIGKGAEAVQTALEMADLFSTLRAAAAR
jgi:6,7-dimethyl-8-ribityllumazine synthase